MREGGREGGRGKGREGGRPGEVKLNTYNVYAQQKMCMRILHR